MAQDPDSLDYSCTCFVCSCQFTWKYRQAPSESLSSRQTPPCTHYVVLSYILMVIRANFQLIIR